MPLWESSVRTAWADGGDLVTVQVEAATEIQAREIIERFWSFRSREFEVTHATGDRRRPLVTNVPRLAAALCPHAKIRKGERAR